MKATESDVKTTLRIPGDWGHVNELLERLPDGYRLTPNALILPDGSPVEFVPMPPDDQFARIFATSCRRPATDEETAIVNNYTVNVGLTGPGGSMDAARTMMQAGAAVVRAGGGGVFIDNSALSHGGSDWIEMAEDGGSDALSFAFVSIVRGQTEVWTMGMHVMGLRDLVMRRTDIAENEEEIIDIIRYTCNSEHPIGDGHLLGDELAPRYQAKAIDGKRPEVGTPMFNPFGRLKLVATKDIAENN